MPDTAAPATELIGVLDMGASAIRLVVAEIDGKRNARVNAPLETDHRPPAAQHRG